MKSCDFVPPLKKLEQQEFISENGMYAKAAKCQRLGIVLSQTALTLKLFKIEKGEYPQKLSELVPRYLPKEYVSPYTGKKLNYILKDGFFTLASDDRTITSKHRTASANFCQGKSSALHFNDF